MGCLTLHYLIQELDDLPASEEWLAPGERIRVAGFRFPKRRNDWVLGRWTAKCAARRFLAHAGVEVPELTGLEIRSAPDGAPEAFLAGLPAPVSLALSHSAGRALCVVTGPGAAPGCDIELVQPHDPSFIVDYFDARERELVEQAVEGEQSMITTMIWSAKESALKSLRQGLRRDTRSVVVSMGAIASPDWSPLSVFCCETGRVFPGWWRESAGLVQTITAGQIAMPPEALES